MTAPSERESERDDALHEEAAAVLARTIREARTAKARLAGRTRVVGFHGEDFEQRWRRVEQIVTAHNDRAARAAWDDAVRAGWTPAELDASGLTLGDEER